MESILEENKRLKKAFAEKMVAELSLNKWKSKTIDYAVDEAYMQVLSISESLPN